MGWIQDIKNMVQLEKNAMNLPWNATTSTSTSTPGICFFTAGGVPMQPPPYKTKMILPASADMEPPTYGEFEDEHPTEIIFELDGWSIERYKGASKQEVDWISHYCPTYGWRYNTDMWCIIADGCCNKCCEIIPEDLIGVWKLKNFDNLPDEDTAKAVLSNADMGASYP